jgi:predicted transcriptional regulator
MTTATLTETFEDTPIAITEVGGARWVRGQDICRALGFADPAKAMEQILKRNRAEFDSTTTCMIDVFSGGQLRTVRLYNARGAALIAMKAQTPKGEAFRRWVLDVLEGRPRDESGPVVASDAIPAGVIDHLQRLFIGARHNAKLIGYLEKGLGTADIAKLLGISAHQVRDKRRAAEFLGMTPVPEYLEERRARVGFKRFEERRNRAHAVQKAKRDARMLALAAPTGEAVDAQ